MSHSLTHITLSSSIWYSMLDRRSCEVTVNTNRRGKIMENYHRICDHNSPMERCPKLVTYRLFQIVIVAGRRERNVKWHPLSDDRKHIWQQCDHCARHFLQEPACLFVSPQKHTHLVLLAMVLEEVWFTRLVSPQQVSIQTFVFVVCGDSYWRIDELPQGPERDREKPQTIGEGLGRDGG